MSRDYWHKQTSDKPLFPDLLWSRPENKNQAGKLLIIGGNSHSFSAPAEAYQATQSAGVGSARVLLPRTLRKIAGTIENADFAAVTPSGGFAEMALSEFLDASSWADGAMLAGDFGKNSETAILLEKFLAKSNKAITLVGDTLDYIISSPEQALIRQNTLLVLEFGQLQKLFTSINSPQAITSGMDLLHLIDCLKDFSESSEVAVVTSHLNQVIVAYDGQVSSTPTHDKLNPIKTAAYAAVWWLQNPGKTFEALTASLIG